MQIMRYTFSIPTVLYTFLTFTGRAHSLPPSALHRRAELTPCSQNLVLTPQLWMEWQMDDYMMNYPNIDKITLTDFARQVGVSNFFCGIGRNCNAGQICSPALDRNWLFLVAVQRQIHILPSSIAVASTIVKDFLFDTHEEKGMMGWAIATLVIGILGGLTGPLVPLFAPKAVSVPMGAYRSEPSLSAAAATYAKARNAQNIGDLTTAIELTRSNDWRVMEEAVSTSRSQVPPMPNFLPGRPLPVSVGHTPTKRSLLPFNISSTFGGSQNLYPRNRLEKRKAPPNAYGFDIAGSLQTHVSEIQSTLLNLFETISQLGNTQPIWSDNGLAGTLLHGAMFAPSPTQIQQQEQHIQFAKLTILSEFLLNLNYFVTVNSDPCHSKGPAGAWTPDKSLSYCTPEGSMRNIIRAEGIHARNEFKNLATLTRDYFSVKFLTDKAIECQQKYGLYTEQKWPAPQDVNSDCVFTLPVCDCSIKSVHEKRHKNRGTVRACREGANLPI